MQPMSVALLEMFVLSKPYFDRQGLILAVDDGQPVGFAHAGFGPGPTGDSLSTDIGVICMLATQPHPDEEAVEAAGATLRELLAGPRRWSSVPVPLPALPVLLGTLWRLRSARHPDGRC